MQRTNFFFILELHILTNIFLCIHNYFYELENTCNRCPFQCIGLGYGVKRHFQQYFRYIMAVSFIGGGNRSLRRKPSPCRKSLTNFITQCCIEHTSAWAGFELTTLVEIGTDCKGSCKPTYHTITTMTAPFYYMNT